MNVRPALLLLLVLAGGLLAGCAKDAAPPTLPSTATGGASATAPSPPTGPPATSTPGGGSAPPAATRSEEPGATPAPGGLPVCQWAEVTKVVDGDTIDVEIDGSADTVRYIGVDSPETVKPGTPVQPWGPEAHAKNEALVGGKRVCLEKDITDRDRYGRLLRYAWLADGTFVNEAMLLAGLAQVSTYPPDVKYLDSRYLPAEHEAQAAGAGMWGDQPPPAPSPTDATATTPAPAGGNCDASYPDVCIPSPPPDLDCADVPYRRFRVLPPDPHHFDGSDHDGLGCEGAR